MKTASVKELKTELSHLNSSELVNLCLTLSRFKKENKELLTYLLFEAEDEEHFIADVKEEVHQLFLEINTHSYYYIKKSIRKILRLLKKYIRYSKKKSTAVELLLYFLEEMTQLSPPYQQNVTLTNLVERQVALIRKDMATLHPDLQYDYTLELRRILPSMK
ncbi:hypothetical protein MWU59_06065 [Flavobacteriaceae bacterium F08102]|nr:hypothetical protein [Flavobacteriaceae bacterium F08102]